MLALDMSAWMVVIEAIHCSYPSTSDMLLDYTVTFCPREATSRHTRKTSIVKTTRISLVSQKFLNEPICKLSHL